MANAKLVGADDKNGAHIVRPYDNVGANACGAQNGRRLFMVSKKITIVVLVFLSLFACAKVEKIEEKNGSDDAETIFNNQNKTTEISPLAR